MKIILIFFTGAMLFLLHDIQHLEAASLEIYSVQPISGLPDFNRPIQRYNVIDEGSRQVYVPVSVWGVPNYSGAFAIDNRSFDLSNDSYELRRAIDDMEAMQFEFMMERMDD